MDIHFLSKPIAEGPLIMGTTSLTYSVVGEAFQAKGLIGLIIYGSIYAIFLLFFDGVIYYTTKQNALTVGILGISVFLAFWGYRSLFALVSFIYPLLLFIIVFRLFSRKSYK